MAIDFLCSWDKVVVQMRPYIHFIYSDNCFMYVYLYHFLIPIFLFPLSIKKEQNFFSPSRIQRKSTHLPIIIKIIMIIIVILKRCLLMILPFHPFVSVYVPARNEQDNIERCIHLACSELSKF